MVRQEAPKRATNGHAALIDEKIGRQDSGANPVGRHVLDHGVEKRHEDSPRGASEEHQDA